MIFVAMSDTHSMHRDIQVPDGDVLIHAGDFSNRGTLAEVHSFADFLQSLPHKHKIVVAGNHDRAFEEQGMSARKILQPVATYLEDSGTEIEGIKIWGSPWTPEYNHWAFNLPRGKPLQEKWDLIPSDTNILITHGPALGLLDVAADQHLGCAHLKHRLRELKHLRHHIFGHIHDGYGLMRFPNAIPHGFAHNVSICTERYRPTNTAQTFKYVR